MKINFISIFLFLSIVSYSQKGNVIIKWNTTRLINLFNSTIQVGAEYYLHENISLDAEIGIRSPLFKDVIFYNKGVFIVHGQIRRYYDNDFFAGFDLGYINEKDYSDFRCMYNKNKKFNADYDSVTLIKNAGTITLICGYQIKVGKVSFDFYAGAGLRLINNKLDYVKETIHTSDCFYTHYDWGNDKYSGIFPGAQFMAGIKLGYLFPRKN